MVREACARDLEAIPFYLNRGLYFQAFDRLYKAFQEFLQALFVARRTYPLAYNKWIYEQVAGCLGLPKLYEKLPPILSVRNIESPEVGEKADDPLAMYLCDIFTVTCNLAGICGLSVPCGFTGGGLPVGLQVLGPAFREEAVLRVGHAYEQATDWHTRAPAEQAS